MVVDAVEHEHAKRKSLWRPVYRVVLHDCHLSMANSIKTQFPVEVARAIALKRQRQQEWGSGGARPYFFSRRWRSSVSVYIEDSTRTLFVRQQVCSSGAGPYLFFTNRPVNLFNPFSCLARMRRRSFFLRPLANTWPMC